MKLGTEIFNEIEMYDDMNELRSIVENEGVDFDYLIDALGALELGKNPETLTRRGTWDKYRDQIDEEIDSMIFVNRYPEDSVLASAMREYADTLDDVDDIAQISRSGYSYEGYVYFVSGCGYDIKSQDLLRCDVDKFLDIVNGR